MDEYSYKKAIQNTNSTDLLKKVFEHKFIIIRSFLNCVSRFSSNNWFRREYGQELTVLEQHKPYRNFYSNPFHYFLLHNQITPTPDIMDNINSFCDKYFKNKLIIGLQLRTGNFPGHNEHIERWFTNIKHEFLIEEAKRIYKYMITNNINVRMYILYTIYIIHTIDF